ncbi:DUF4142 domain-containing protein [Rhodopseudomonas sp. HC1]|uniref:DUF4142 domain-containing protein n=1 Tax=Rhodopseudomonas infernalis TaxID=2897386 RepID=UPI001EE7A95E|nr:DUF4142 domain-containing protein [Rhodopseudomonas infernalis]MCG6205978.1 DUF4142 domain-containing protein [Rhodopseudomonas infernalis]
MKRTMIALGCCLLMATPVLAQSVGEKTGVNSVLGVAPTTADFVRQAAISDMFEIQSSKLAEQKGDTATKAFAKEMVADHTKTSTELKSLISAGKVKAELPTQLDDAHRSKLDKLTSASGADFNETYVEQQISAHKDAVSLFDRYARGGESAELKTWAGKTLPALKHHLDMAQTLDKQRSNTTSQSTKPGK